MKQRGMGMKQLRIAIIGIMGAVLLMGISWQRVEASLIYNPGEVSDDLVLDTSYYLTAPSDSVKPYRWYWDIANRFPIDFELVQGSADIGDGSDFAAIDSALETWTNVQGSSIVATSSSYDNDWGGLNGDNEIAWVESGWAGDGFPSNAIGVTWTWYNSITLIQVESDIFLNGQDFTWYTDTDGSGGTQYVEHILLHELGHAFSLKDLYNTGDSERTMYGYSGSKNEDVTLHSYDESAISYAYPVPEPASLLLLGLGGLALLRRRRA